MKQNLSVLFNFKNIISPSLKLFEYLGQWVVYDIIKILFDLIWSVDPKLNSQFPWTIVCFLGTMPKTWVIETVAEQYQGAADLISVLSPRDRDR